MTNQPWSSGQPQGQPGWQQGQSPNPGPPQPRWQQAPGQTQGFSGPGGQPPRGGSKLPLVIGAIVLLAAIVAVAAFFLTRPGEGPTASVSPSTSATAASPEESTGPTDEPNGGDIREFTFDDAPQEVNGWAAQSVPEGHSGMFYAKDGAMDEAGLDLMINVINADLPFDVAVSDLEAVRESAAGRVRCGVEGVLGQVCYVETNQFGVLAVSPTAEAPDEDVSAVAEAIAELHP